MPLRRPFSFQLCLSLPDGSYDAMAASLDMLESATPITMLKTVAPKSEALLDELGACRIPHEEFNLTSKATNTERAERAAADPVGKSPLKRPQRPSG